MLLGLALVLVGLAAEALGLFAVALGLLAVLLGGLLSLVGTRSVGLELLAMPLGLGGEPFAELLAAGAAGTDRTCDDERQHDHDDHCHDDDDGGLHET